MSRIMRKPAQLNRAASWHSSPTTMLDSYTCLFIDDSNIDLNKSETVQRPEGGNLLLFE